MALKSQDQFTEALDTDSETFWINAQLNNTGDQVRVVAKETPFSIRTGGGLWDYNGLTTDSDPGSGQFKLNNADESLATFVYLSNFDLLGQNVSVDVLAMLTGDKFTIVENTFRGFEYTLSGVAIDGGAYLKIPVTNTLDLGGDLSTNARCEIKGVAPSAAVIAEAINEEVNETNGWVRAVDDLFNSSNKRSLDVGNGYSIDLQINALGTGSDTSQFPDALTEPWDTGTNKIAVDQADDMFDFTLAFVANNGNQDVFIKVEIDVGGTTGVIFSRSINIEAGNSTETNANVFGQFVTSADMVSNGGTVTISSNADDMDLWDFSILLFRKFKANV